MNDKHRLIVGISGASISSGSFKSLGTVIVRYVRCAQCQKSRQGHPLYEM